MKRCLQIQRASAAATSMTSWRRVLVQMMPCCVEGGKGRGRRRGGEG